MQVCNYTVNTYKYVFISALVNQMCIVLVVQFVQLFSVQVLTLSPFLPFKYAVIIIISIISFIKYRSSYVEYWYQRSIYDNYFEETESTKGEHKVLKKKLKN